jgi:curved DNA-binding protein CbpA
MSISLPKFDPYAVLGVEKDRSLSDIKSAYRKLVLRCHPDKIKDESLRSKAQDEFQRVQKAYEMLSDESSRARYDNEVRLVALRKEAIERAAANGEPSPYSTSRGREYRDGRIYEERTPAGASYVDEDEEVPFTEEPRAYSRKYDDYGKRPHTKVTEEKKKSKSVPVVTPRTVKETLRDNVKASHHDRAKHRTKERRREFSDKYERTAAYVVTDDESSGSDIPTVYVKEKRPSESRRSRDSAPRRSKTEPAPSSSRKSESRRYHRDEDDEEVAYSDEWESKFDHLQSSVRDYIMRSKSDTPIEIGRHPRASRSPPTYGGYESSDRYERETTRYSSRGNVRAESARVAAVSPPRGSHQRRSSERLDHDRKVPSMPTAASSPKVPSSSRHPPPLRSATAPYPRSSRREGSRSGEFDRLSNMVSEGVSPRTKLRPSDRYDSGYSSPGTPEMPQGSGSGPAKVNRYKIVDPPETIVVEPSEPHHHRYHRSTSPLRPERPNIARRGSATTTTTYTYSADAGARYETARPSTSSRPPLSRVYEEVRYAKPIKPENVQYGYPRYTTTRQPAY